MVLALYIFTDYLGNNMRTLFLLTAVVLIIGIFSLPIGYYTFLRILVTISAIAYIIHEYNGELTPGLIVFGIIAIIFNPLIPIYLHNKGLWTIIDVITAFTFLAKSFTLQSNQKPT